MKRSLISILLISLVACDNREVSYSKVLKPDLEAKQLQEIKEEDSSIFATIEKAKISSYDVLSKRYFVIIDSSIVYDYRVISHIICELTVNNETDSNTSISFFTNQKWANYKDLIFSNIPEKHPIEEYQNWLNIYYQGEFDFKTREYNTYPVSDPKMNKRKSSSIKKC